MEYVAEPIEDLVLSGKQCPYCTAETEYVDSSTVYRNGVSYGMVYVCRPCDAWVGVHQGTDIAKGRLADRELREAKKEAHFYFDGLWKKKIELGDSKHVARSSAYKWLSKAMNIPVEKTHIGMFDVAQCKEATRLCKQYYKKA